MPSDWRTGSRTERYEYRLLDLAYAPVGVLSGVESCTLDGSIWAPIRWGGSLTWSGLAGTAPVWSQVLVQPYYIVDGAGEWPLGVYLCKAPTTRHGSALPSSVAVELYDVTYRLAHWAKLPAPLSLAAGTVVTTAIAAQLTAAGITRSSVTTSTATLPAPMGWDPGVSRLEVVNDLCGAIGYWSAHADPDGVVRIAPYRPPAERSPSWRFEPGAASIYLPEWAEDVDDFDIPNRLTGIQRVTDGVTPATYTATLDALDATSPYTYATRGFWVDGETLRDSDAADLAALTLRVKRALLDAASVTRSLTVSHAWLPTVGLAAVVDFVPDGQVRRATVGKQRLDLSTGLVAVSEWREVTV